jgi:diguanylate cyclase (GGDEF)-like protein
MSLRGKFWIGFGLIALLATGLSIYGERALGTTAELIVRLYDEPLMGVNYARAASAALDQAGDLMNQPLSLEPGSLANVAASLRHLQGDIVDDLRVVRQRVHDPGVAGAADRVDAAAADWFRNEMAILAPPAPGLTTMPMPAAVERQGAAAIVQVNDLVELVTAYGYANRVRAQAEMRGASATLGCLAGAVSVVSAIFAALLAQHVIRPIRAATRIAEAVAAGQTVPLAATRRRDEIGRLLTSLATMQASLRSREARAEALMREKDRAAETLRQTNLRFETALNNMSHGLLMCDADARVVVFNRQFCALYGIAADALEHGASYRDLVALSVAAGNHPGRTVDEALADRAPILQSRERTLATRTIAGGRIVAISFEPMPDGGWITTQEDISERRRSEEQIVFLARHDALTRLPNRVTFMERLDQASALAERGRGFALLYLDLDQFKAVNDTLGHPTGDELLCAVASRLQGAVRDSDTVARLGGDEFAILQSGATTPADAAVLARRLIEVVARPYDLDGQQVVVGVSIGIALGLHGGVHPIQLMKSADLALYRAKQDGRGTWRFFEPEMDAAAKARRALELDLRSALPLGQLELHYQPVVSSRNRYLTGFEALLRWRHPTRGLVPPGDFISVAEEIGAIVPIGAWVLRQACAEAATWPNHLSLAVNLSPMQFRGHALLATVADALRLSGVAPQRLELEVTESVLLRDDHATLSILHDLRALGTRIAMDDFGTGYSSLSYLRVFPFDTIKIDGSFVKELQSRDDCVAIVRAITALGSNLHMKTIAEGVETEEQFELLADAGCTEIQGYLFSKPVPADQLAALIDRLSGRPAEVFETA